MHIHTYKRTCMHIYVRETTVYKHTYMRIFLPTYASHACTGGPEADISALPCLLVMSKSGQAIHDLHVLRIVMPPEVCPQRHYVHNSCMHVHSQPYMHTSIHAHIREGVHVYTETRVCIRNACMYSKRVYVSGHEKPTFVASTWSCCSASNDWIMANRNATRPWL